jgi:hypothetical protein
MMHDVIQQWCVQDGRRIELLPGDGGADDGKDAGADDCSNAQGGERPRAERLLKPMLGLLRFGDQLVDGLAGEQLVRQISAPEQDSKYKLTTDCPGMSADDAGISLAWVRL